MNQTIGVNITPQSFQPTLHYSQGDVGRVFVVNVTDYDIPSGATVTCVATKPSGMGFTVSGTVSGNSVTFTSTAEMTDEWGRFPAEIRIASGNTLLGTANFLMVGEKDPHPASTIDGTQEELIPQLTLLVNRVEAAAESVHDLTVSATTLTAGSDATATYDITNNSIAFGIPRGADGDVTRSEFNDLKSEISDIYADVGELGIFVQSTNIFSGEYTENTALDANGNLIEFSDYGTTDYIPVVGGKTIYLGYVNSQQYQTLGAGVAARYAIYDGAKSLVSANTNAWVSNIVIPSNGKYVRFTASHTRLSGDYEVAYDSLPTIYTPYTKEYWKPKNEAQVEQNTSDIEELKLDTDYDVAVGGMFETATTNDVSTGYIASIKCEKKQRRNYTNKRIVAVNHDDLQPSDYLATRKIYNKYGFKANFNFILLPFASAEQQERMVKNVKALVSDGHDLGLHAIMGASFWWMNKMWDLRPTFATTFAPELSDLKTVDASGKNVFGYTVGNSTKFENIGYANPPSQVTSVLVKDATTTDWIYLTVNYTLYTMYMSTVSGLDLDGNTQNWTGLHWLEYWYNELIDDTLGYSKNSQSLANNYVADYAVPSGTAETSAAYNAVYPDATHLLNGKVVKFDDTTNPHFSDADYQKVGYFTKGLFKGCVSACNYEVIDRCIDIAKAFCKHYFGVDKFTNFGRHGVRYASCMWKDSNYVPYDNRGLNVLTGEVGKFYHSRSGKFLTEQDILLDKGIRMTNHNHPLNPIFESEVGLYYGQSGIRYPFFNHALDIWNGAIDYLALFGTSPSGASETMDYDTFISYMGGRDNWLKFAYENANSYITKPDGTGSMYMFGRVKKTIDMIRACFDTGKIPVFSWDTIKLNAATMAAVELVCQYCYANNIDIVPMEYAREMATNNSREYMQNWFPNPSFTQSVLNMFGGTSTSPDAYRPDGWVSAEQGGTVEYSVADETVDSKTMKVLTISMGANSYANLQGRIYGLPAGKYRFSVYLKRSDYAFNFRLYLKKNKDFINRYYGDGNIKFNPDVNFSATSEWVLYEQEIEIPEFHVNAPSDTVAGQYCKGYEDNISNITYEVSIQQRATAHDVFIAMPKIERIY